MATSTTEPIAENGLLLYPEKSSLARLRYFFGQLLTQRDLEAEQKYHLVLQRLMQREMFGTGTTAGLRVVREKNSVEPPLGVFVEPGLAFDPDGRELILENEECIDVAEAPVTGTATPFPGPPATKQDLADEVAARFGEPFAVGDLDAVVNALTDCGLMTGDERDDYFDSDDISVIMPLLELIPPSTPTIQPPALLRDWVIDQLVGITYIGLRYRELGSDPSPAVLDASCCGDVSCFPSRTSQGVFIVTSQEPFAEVADPYQQLKACIDAQFFAELDATSPSPPPAHVDSYAALCDCLTAPEAWRGLPPVDDPCGALTLPIVCIARVCWRKFIDGTEDNILHIDNCGCRKLAPGGPAIRALVESLTGNAAPTTLLPRIVSIEPENGASFTAAQTAAGLTIRAVIDALSDDTTGNIEDGWELLFYEPDATTVERFFDVGLPGPGGSTVAVEFADPGTTEGRAIEIRFTGGTGFAPGTYVWRVPLPGTEVTSVSNAQILDAEPNPPTGVPSGNGQGGGVFEARFVVTA